MRRLQRLRRQERERHCRVGDAEGTRGVVLEAAPGRNAHTRRHDHLRPAERQDAELHLPVSRQETQAPTTMRGSIMCLPLYNNFPRRPPGLDFSLSLANKPRSRRRQDRHDHAEAGATNGMTASPSTPRTGCSVSRSSGPRSPRAPPIGARSCRAISPRASRAPARSGAVHRRPASHACLQPGLLSPRPAGPQPHPAAQPGWTSPRRGPSPGLERPRRTRRRSTTTSIRRAARWANFGSNLLWKIADGPYVLTSFSPVTAS